MYIHVYIILEYLPLHLLCQLINMLISEIHLDTVSVLDCFNHNLN